MEVENGKIEYEESYQEHYKDYSMEDKLIGSEDKLDYKSVRENKNKSRSSFKILENINSPSKKSLEATIFMKSRMFELIEEERQFITLKEIDIFSSSDFDVLDSRQGRIIKHISEWIPLQSETEEKADVNFIKDKNNKDEEKSGNRSIIIKGSNINNENIYIQEDTQNIIFKNKIIKPINRISDTKNSGIEIELQILMAGESSFYIFTRGDYFTSDVAVCCIEKELDSSRKFISFAVLEIKNDGIIIIKTLKKQEIPKSDHKYISSLDVCEVNLLFMDNCENKTSLLIKNKNSSDNDLFFHADIYSPVNDIVNVMLGASGDLISLKNLSIKKIKKNSIENNSDKINQTCCCGIF